jgi:hypothetical protein
MPWGKPLRVPAEFSAQLFPDRHRAPGPDWCWRPGLTRCLLDGLDNVIGARMPPEPCGERSFLHIAAEAATPNIRPANRARKVIEAKPRPD